jgi:hypothetical protein
MNKRFVCGVAFVAAMGIVLGGCDNKSDKHRDGDGQAEVNIGNVKVRAKDEHSLAVIPLPQNMPSYAAVYPGADVKAVLTVNEAEMGTMISYTTNAKPEDVMAFYKKNAEAASLEGIQEVKAAGLWNFMAKGKNSAANLTVTMVTENGKLTVQETYK